MTQTKPALILIDIQNDYFDGFAFPQHGADALLSRLLNAVKIAKEKAIPIILVQHVADASKGMAPFFNEGTEGVAIHPALLAELPDAPIVIKHSADAFRDTDLAETLEAAGATELLICGMMTQNCVTHTAISRQADAYKVGVLSDLSTSVSEMIHLIALNALAPLVEVGPSEALL
nr:isochorismatase family protein [uncultured Cohaesibacter sp.]